MPPFQVQTLDKARLQRASAELAAIAAAFEPDMLVGIRSGGYKVALEMAPYFPSIPLLPFTCRRPSTKKKQSFIGLRNLLHKLPNSITNRLRICEHIVLTQLLAKKHSAFTADANELAMIKNHLQKLGPKPKILIVDDAVDSGATLAAAVSSIKNIAPDNTTIKTAVITVTTASPFVEPNFMLYRYVLCRFPWSLDFKN
jgi:hypoxanthine phosphoribosyltransferase